MGWDSLVLTASRFKRGGTAAAPRSPCTARCPGADVCAQRDSACGSSDARQPAAPGRARVLPLLALSVFVIGLVSLETRRLFIRPHSARYPKNTGGRRKMDGWIDPTRSRAGGRTPRSPADEFIASLPRSLPPPIPSHPMCQTRTDDTRIADECALGMPEEPTRMWFESVRGSGRGGLVPH